jgi:hypothetical protein
LPVPLPSSLCGGVVLIAALGLSKCVRRIA